MSDDLVPVTDSTDDPIKYIGIDEFREFGYLQEVNRRFFHPLGLALEVRTPGWTKESIDGWLREQGVQFGQDAIDNVWTFVVALGLNRDHLGGVWDYRDDPEGVVFGDPPDREKYERVREEWHTRRMPRVERLRYFVQQVEDNADHLGLPVLLGQAMAAEFTFMGASEESWTKMAKGVLDKVVHELREETFDPANVHPEEIHLIDLVLFADADPTQTRIEKINGLVDEITFWKERAEMAESVLSAARKVEGLDEVKRMREIIDDGFSSIAAHIGG